MKNPKWYSKAALKRVKDAQNAMERAEDAVREAQSEVFRAREALIQQVRIEVGDVPIRINTRVHCGSGRRLFGGREKGEIEGIHCVYITDKEKTGSYMPACIFCGCPDD